jgi:subtilisin family serine protease
MIQFDPTKMSWGHKWYNIPFIWNDLNTMGRGITVAVIDTGVDNQNEDLISNIHESSRSFIDNDLSITDVVGHGTKMAGIIGATGKHKVYGVAPECKLLILKASNQERGPDVKPFIDALNYASSIQEVDIVSFSSVFDNDVNLKGAVEKCINNDKIVVASIGDARNFIGNPNGPDDDTFPACYTGVIAVGAFDQQGKLCNFSNWNQALSFLAPGDDYILTTGLDDSTAMGGQTSIAAAFTSGCLAILLSYAKIKSITPKDCINAIFCTCDDYGPTIGKDIQSGYGLMNLRNAIAKIKKP